LKADERAMRQIRGRRAGFILQDPKFSLNPVKTVGHQVAEAVRLHKNLGRRAAWDAAGTLFEQVKIRDPKKVLGAYPH
ncbi:glutathione ABC transporter ATP-binding protein, partial [Mycobacterium tuberculosis]|nr:glutathione ABC transporter ATP-binding protein [Mycobacterium tuberculosis]